MGSTMHKREVCEEKESCELVLQINRRLERRSGGLSMNLGFLEGRKIIYPGALSSYLFMWIFGYPSSAKPI